MSWKPCRGGRVLLDRAVKDSHECFFAFKQADTLKQKSKIAFKWYKADSYLSRNIKTFWAFLGEDFISDCRNSKDTYKPFLNVINQQSKN